MGRLRTVWTFGRNWIVRPRPILRTVVLTFLGVLAAAGLAAVDPMGLDEASDRHSADVIGRFTAPNYGGDEVVGRDLISVVEVSDLTLRELSIEWPPPRSFYTDLLRVLAPEGGPRPAAIFLDYTLLTDLGDERGHQTFIREVRRITNAWKWEQKPECRATPEAKVACIIKASGTPVVLGKDYIPDLCRYGLGDDVSALVPLEQSAVMAPLGWPGAPEVVRPVLTLADYEAQILGHPATDESRLRLKRCRVLYPARTSTGELITMSRVDELGAPATWHGVPHHDLAPATAMFAALCGSGRAPKDTCADLNTPGRPAGWSGPSEVALTWGSTPDRGFLKLRQSIYGYDPKDDAACEAEQRSWKRFAHLGWTQLTSAIGQGVAATRVPCPYHPTIDFSRLKEELESGGPEAAALREQYIAGRAIMVGAAMVSTSDWVDNVVNGRLAGVHFHAMMLDNMVELGADMLRPPPPLFDDPRLAWLGLDQGEVLEFGIALLTALVIALSSLGLKTVGAGPVARLTALVCMLAIAVLIFGLATWFTILTHWTPVNIVGLSALTIVFAVERLWRRSDAGWFACRMGERLVSLWRWSGRVARRMRLAARTVWVRLVDKLEIAPLTPRNAKNSLGGLFTILFSGSRPGVARRGSATKREPDG